MDFFCGAGGFSEGFRQQGFKIIMGLDNWAPAVATHNLNHDLDDKPVDITRFWSDIDRAYDDSIQAIEELPEADVIVGSPPCVSFSMSNNSGKADKTRGLLLIKSFLRVVAVRKHSPMSSLVAWYMENVPKSRLYVKEFYSFRDLNLALWARRHGLDPDSVALPVRDSGGILNSADYGSPQSRDRFICGELIVSGKFVFPIQTHFNPAADASLFAIHKTLHSIRSIMPLPNSVRSVVRIVDPNYPGLAIPLDQLSDHFYDSGIYAIEWEKARELKLNHAYMGRMSFPEDETRTSRTILATRSPNSREAIIYRSEYDRKGNGEFRTPTIREAATIMGFPYVYQFNASGESTKWRLIGNAVCPHLSSAIAKALRIALGHQAIPDDQVSFEGMRDHHKEIENLNVFAKSSFDSEPQRKSGSKFRMHPFKSGNMTVAFTNFRPYAKKIKKLSVGEKWHSSVFLGTGEGFGIHVVNGHHLGLLESFIKNELISGKDFVREIRSKFKGRVASASKLQEMFEANIFENGYLGPDSIVASVRELAIKYDPMEELCEHPLGFLKKKLVPKRQLFTMYAFDFIARESEHLKRGKNRGQA